MKCPKCGYLGYETTDRCRNCGYDFLLAAAADAPAELPLHPRDIEPAPLTDFSLGGPDPPRVTPAGLDLDRLIGADEPVEKRPAAAGASVSAAETEPTPMPLFARRAGSTDAPVTPRPAGPPLAVRRATPDGPRSRSRTRRTPRRDEPPAGFELEPVAESPGDASPPERTSEEAPWRLASPIARIIASLIDLVLIASIDAAVLYFTLAVAGLPPGEIGALPPVPLAAFLILLNGGYLIAFTVAGGQTVGKMATGLVVIGDDGRRVDIAGAALRAAGCGLSLATLGAGYLPAFLTASRRALHDRLARTQVIRVR
jgi:uncharacterized RDD family membrane protein YckC